jgi:hypothetical protein
VRIWTFDGKSPEIQESHGEASGSKVAVGVAWFVTETGRCVLVHHGVEVPTGPSVKVIDTLEYLPVEVIYIRVCRRQVVGAIVLGYGSQPELANVLVDSRMRYCQHSGWEADDPLHHAMISFFSAATVTFSKTLVNCEGSAPDFLPYSSLTAPIQPLNRSSLLTRRRVCAGNNSIDVQCGPELNEIVLDSSIGTLPSFLATILTGFSSNSLQSSNHHDLS